jgi:polyisoprenoid-binding protein YceI
MRLHGLIKGVGIWRGIAIDRDGPLGKDAQARVEATIEAASIETRESQRDTHLKSADFLHVEKFPTLSFKSTDIKVADDGELKVQGDLTIRGVTRKVTFAVEGPTPPTKDPWGKTRIAISATTKVNPRGTFIRHR